MDTSAGTGGKGAYEEVGYYVCILHICNRASESIVRKRAIIQTTVMKEKHVHSGQLARIGKGSL